MRNKYTKEQTLNQKSITREELRALVDEFLAKGGKITQCPPGVAYDLRSDNVRWLSKPVPSKKTIAPTILPLLYKNAV